MIPQTTHLIRYGLAALYYSGSHRLLAPITRGVGVILMLHRVSPDTPHQFEPNRILRVTPEFLEAAIGTVRDAGFDIVSLDDAHRRLVDGEHERPFACVTLDDGYLDNRDHAYPVFRRLDVPFTIYVPSSFADGQGDLWWLSLESVIAAVDEVSLKIDGGMREFACGTVEEKYRTFNEIYWWLRGIDEVEARRVVRDLCRGIGLDPSYHGRSLMMSWDDLRAMSGDPLVTIGAHTRHHFALSKLSEAAARAEIAEGARRLEQETGIKPRHMSYPYGTADAAGEREFRIAKELGFKTAVTTRKGLIHAEHVNRLTALPRLSLNGDYQDMRYLQVLLSGAPFSLMTGFRHVA